MISEVFVRKFGENLKDFLNCEVNFKDFEGFVPKLGEKLKDLLQFLN